MSGPCRRPECGSEVHTDPWGTPVQCPHAPEAEAVSAPGDELAPRLDEWMGRAENAEAAIKRVRQLHRPVDHHGMTICAACSGWDGSTTDNSPCGYGHCPTLKALGPQETP